MRRSPGEISAALRLGEGHARRLVYGARRLRTHLPGALTAMRAGDLSLTKARTLIDTTERLDPDQCAAVEARVLPGATRVSTPLRSPARCVRSTRTAGATAGSRSCATSR